MDQERELSVPEQSIIKISDVVQCLPLSSEWKYVGVLWNEQTGESHINFSKGLDSFKYAYPASLLQYLATRGLSQRDTESPHPTVESPTNE
jgi:hypothetical protein